MTCGRAQAKALLQRGIRRVTVGLTRLEAAGARCRQDVRREPKQQRRQQAPGPGLHAGSRAALDELTFSAALSAERCNAAPPPGCHPKFHKYNCIDNAAESPTLAPRLSAYKSCTRLYRGLSRLEITSDVAQSELYNHTNEYSPWCPRRRGHRCVSSLLLTAGVPVGGVRRPRRGMGGGWLRKKGTDELGGRGGSDHLCDAIENKLEG